MTSAFPIFVGITGKRSLSSETASAKEAECKIRERLAAALDYIEDILPDTPKILLTGAAAGADLLAAEEVLRSRDCGKRRQNWLVLAALPFEPTLFKQDFTPDECATYERVCADARTCIWVLPPLKTADGERAQSADLTRRADSSETQKELRRRHYEQVGLWIADTANVLIAVMPPDEKPEKIGGTARIVAWRRGGRPDRIARDVIGTSNALAPRPDLLRPPGGYVWLIDPLSDGQFGDLPIIILPPALDEAARSDVYEAPGLPTFKFDGRGDASHATPPDQRPAFERSKNLLKIAQSYEKDCRKSNSTKQNSPIKSWPEGRDPATVLKEIADKLREPAYRAMNRYRHALAGLMGLFILAVLAFEVYAKFLHENYFALLGYIAFVVAIISLYSVARKGEWQPNAEDRRAIREVLRVQLAWWWVGLSDRVDYLHLQGADPDLASVREAARNVITWACLASRDRPPAAMWSMVFAPDDRPPFDKDMPVAEYPKDWIGNQWYYFRQREAQRESKGQLIDALSWILFMTSAWLAALLFFWLTTGCVRNFDEAILHTAQDFPPWIVALAGLAGVSGASGCWWLAGWKRHLKDAWRLSILLGPPAAIFLWIATQLVVTLVVDHQSRWSLGVAAVAAIYAVYWCWKVLPDTNSAQLTASVLGLGDAMLFALAIMAFAAASAGYEFEHSAQYTVIVLSVFLLALAGGMRFLSEKLAVEAEALSYRDARGWFEHAEKLLGALQLENGDPAAEAEARRVVKELGRLALSENEAWLKARRERPLSPVI